MPKKPANKFYSKPPGKRFMPPGSFAPSRGLPKPGPESPGFKSGGKVRTKKGK